MLTGQSNTVDAGPEVLSSPKRRRFSVQDKRRLVREYEATPSGERGAFLRRNGLYSSYIDNWRKLVEGAAIQALEPQKRGPKPQPKPNPELERLRRANALLKVRRWGYRGAADFTLPKCCALPRTQRSKSRFAKHVV
jgi:transposase-like protein